MPKDTFTVYYWIGGREVGTWHKAVPLPTREAAQSLVRSLNTSGRVAHYNSTRSVDCIGLPDDAPRDVDFKAIGL